MSEKKIIIIGGGGAGLAAAQAARENAPQSSICLICGENRLPYYRLRICEVLSGLTAEKLTVRSQDWLQEKNIQIIMDTAQSIDSQEQSVLLANGQKLAYDTLILATGGQGNLLPAPGNDKKGVMTFRTLEDIAQAQAISGPAIIIGGGLLGLEAAWHLRQSGREVAIVNRSAALLDRQLDQEAGEFFQDIVKKAGVEIILNGNLAEIKGESPSLTLALQDGREYPASLVIFAAGIHSQTALANSAGLKVEKGILVNEKMATSLENIYACGDCAQLNGKVMGLWSVAQAQGAIAGANAAGQERAYQSLEPNYMMNSMGTKIWSMGDIKAPDNFCQKDPQTGQLQKLFFQDNLLTGGILIGDISLQIKIKEAFKNKLGKNEALALIKK